jgi:prepilin-type N-terminal cleavage/methylation domain-containing protein
MEMRALSFGFRLAAGGAAARRRFLPGAIRGRRASVRGAFTLVELLIVIAIVLIVLSVALPMFNVINDSHSIEGARNKMSAMLARSRSQAIGLYRLVGVAFFRDTATDRYVMRQVAFLDPNNPTSIDFTPDSDDETLAPGVAVQVLHNAVKPAGSSPPFVERYVSMGVIMFDGQGILATVPYTVPGGSQLAARSGISFTSPISTQVAIAVYDRERFRNQGYTDADPVMGGASSNESAEESWLDMNALTLMVNRYDGTFMEPRKLLGRPG